MADTTQAQLPKEYRVSAKALITNEAGDLLLIQERGTHWSIPGGSLEHGEQPREALKRELYEELGVNALQISDRPRFVWTAQSRKGWWCLQVCYLATLDSLDFTLEDGIQSAQFFPTDQLHKLEIDPAEAPIVQHYA